MKIFFLLSSMIGAAAALAAVGCSSTAAGELTGSSEQSQNSVIDEPAELDSVLGNDRVGKVLRASPTQIPVDLGGFEQLFKVGRACNRVDSKEIFVVEEKGTRITGKQEDATELLPRLVVGGCNQHPAGSSMRETFELFLAVVSDKERSIDDPLSLTPNVEAMALDDTTGLFNFYVIEAPAVANAPGTVTRFVRLADNTVQKWQKVAGKKATKELSVDPTSGQTDRKCFDCHVHGGPVMNELTEPWTNWVSSHKNYSRGSLTGDSRSLVSESRPFSSEHVRSSLANQLEQVTRASIQMWVEGIPGRPGSGLGPQIMSGAQPGGVSSLLKSVFCETEVNYATVHDTVPMSLFLDKTMADVAVIEPPIAGVRVNWKLLPVRSETDLRIERFLRKTNVLRSDTALAIRVIDDEREVFSTARCDLHAPVAAKIASGTAPDAAIREVLLAALVAEENAPAGTPAAHTQAQRDFMRSLLDPAADPVVRDAAQTAYVTELTARFQQITASLETSEGEAAFEQRWVDRQASARAMFPTAANPLPITHVPN